MEEILKRVKLKDINLDDSFFDSLRNDYLGFDQWFLRKAQGNHDAFVKYGELNKIQAFLMLQIKDNPEEDIVPLQSVKRRIKISTLKIDKTAESQRLSEAMMNIIFAEMDSLNINEAYVTLFKDRHPKLYDVLKSWGFIDFGTKSDEIVLMKSKNQKFLNDIKKDYRWYFNGSNWPHYNGSNFYLVAFEGQYHDKLLPNNKLKGVISEAKEFDTSSISITKTYLSGVAYNIPPKPGDFILEYRKSKIRPVSLHSAVTGVGIVIDVIDARNYSFDDYKKKIGNTSVFSTEKELQEQFDRTPRARRLIIRFLHIFSFGKGNNVTYKSLQDMRIWLKNDNLTLHEIENKTQTINLILKKWRITHENFNVNS